MTPLRVCGLVTVVRPHLTSLRALRESLVLCEVTIETEPWFSFNVALPFFFGGLAVGNLRPLLFIFFLLAFLANMAREIAKGIADIVGDSAKGVRTVAVVMGTSPAARMTASLFAVAVVLSFTAPLFDNVSLFYYPGVAVADVGFLYSSYRLLRDQTPKTVRAVKTQVLFWMLLGLVGFLMGGSPIL